MALECKKSSGAGLIVSNLSGTPSQNNNDQPSVVGTTSHEVICGMSKKRMQAEVDLREVYFLIMHFLSSGPCRKTCAQLLDELSEHNLLPRRYHAWYSRAGACSGDSADDGISVPLSYPQLLERYSFIERNHLVKLLEQLYNRYPEWGSHYDARNPTAADASTLLGIGSVSILNSDQCKKKQGGCLWKPAGQTRGLTLRELGGGLARHHQSPSIRAASYAIVKPSVLVDRIKIIKTFRGHRNAVYCAIFDKSGEYIITGSDDRLVKIWSTATGFCLRSCRGHEGDITDLAVSANNALVASASNDCFIRVWRFPDGLPVSVLKGHTSAVTAIAFSPRLGCEHHLLSTSDDGTCRIWDARDSSVNARIYAPKSEGQETGSKVSTSGPQNSQSGTQILCCAFNASGTVFVTGSADKLARVWDACKWTDEHHGAPNHELDTLKGHEDDVNYVQFSGCAGPSRPINTDAPTKDERISRFRNSWYGYESIVTCSRDGSAIIWGPRPRKYHGKSKWTKAYHLRVPPPPMPPQPPRGVPRQRLLPTPRGVNMIVWSLDNRYVLAAIMDCRICVWNAVDGSLVHSLTGHTKSTFVLDVHPYDPRLAMSAGYDGRVIIWDIWEGCTIHVYEIGEFHLVDGKFSPDGTSIVVSDEVGQIYLLATGEGESQKDAKYDQFFLGDYRPLMRDMHGNVLDQETQLPPHQRNLQDLLCDASMVPYAEPYQSMYQQRRLGAIGISWQPPSVPFAVGTMDDSSYVPTILPGMLLPPDEEDSRLGAHQGGNRWVEQPVDEDVMEWEQDSVDDAGSDYTLSHENATDEDERDGSLSSTEELLDSLEEEDSSDDEDTNQRTHLRRSERNKRKAESTSSGRLAKRKCKERGEYSLRRSKRRLKRKSLSRRSSRNSSDDEQPKRPKRLAARNARLIFSQISADEDDQVSPWQDTPSDSSENLQSSGDEQVSRADCSEKESEGIQKDEHAVTAETDPSEVDYSRRTRSKSSSKSKYGNIEGHKSLNTESALDKVTEGAASSPLSILQAVHGSALTSTALYQSSPKEKATSTVCNEKVKETVEHSGDSLHSGDSKHGEQIIEIEGEILLGKRASGDVNWKLKKRARMNDSMERFSQFNEDGPSSSRSDDHCQKAHGKSKEYANGMGIPADLTQSTAGSSEQSDKGNQQGKNQCILEASEIARRANQEAVQSLQADAGDHFDTKKGEIRHKVVNSYDHPPAKDICNTEEEEVSSKVERMFNHSGSCSDEQSVQEPGSRLEKEANGVNIDGGLEGITNTYLKHNQHEFLGHSDSIGEERQLGTELEGCPSEEDTLLKEELGFLEGEQGFSHSEATVSQERTPIAKNNTVEKFYSRREHVVPKGEDLLLSNTYPRSFEKNKTPSVYFRRNQMRGTSWQRDSPTCLWLRQHTEAQVAEQTPSLDGSSDGEKLLDKTEQGEASDEGTKITTLRRSGRKTLKCIKGGSIEPGALQNGQKLNENSVRNTAYAAEEIGRLLDPKKTKIIFRTRRTAEATTSGTAQTAQHYDRTHAGNHGFGVDKKESRFSLRPRGDASWKDGTLHKDSNKALDDLSWKGKKRSKKKASWVMLTKVEEGTRYIPQLGDEVAYVLQGQDEFPDIRHLEDKGPPKALRARLRSVEICRVVGLEYASLAGFNGVTCKLTLKLIDEECKACGKTFMLSLPELIDFPDFLIERSRYEAGMRRHWTKRDKCKVWWRTNTVDENRDEKAGEWYIGRVVAVTPKSEQFSDSPWEECIVQYKGDNTGPHRHSPWELFDIESSEVTSAHLDDSKKHQVLSVIEEVEDSCRSSEDDYGLNRLGKLLHRVDFLSKTLVPLSLETIKARLENNYYRSLEALHHDIELLVTNVTFDAELSSKVQKLASRLLGDEG